MSRKYNQGRITDYTGADMADPVQRRKALDDYIGRTGWKMTQVQRAELVDASCKLAEQQINRQLDASSGQSASCTSRLSAPADSSQAVPLTLRTAWKAWV